MEEADKPAATAPEAPSNSPSLTTQIESRVAFQECLRSAFDEAARAGCRELWMSDTDFANWPLGERRVVESLTMWAYAHRKLTMLASNFDGVVRLHPRWVEWRRQWAHVVHCRTNTELETGEMPTLLIAPGLFSLNLIDPVHYRGRWSHETPDQVRDRGQLDAVLQHSTEAFPAGVTGL